SPDGFSTGSVPVATTEAPKSALPTFAGLSTAGLAEGTPTVNGPIPSAHTGVVPTRSAATIADFLFSCIGMFSYQIEGALSGGAKNITAAATEKWRGSFLPASGVFPEGVRNVPSRNQAPCQNKYLVCQLREMSVKILPHLNDASDRCIC